MPSTTQSGSYSQQGLRITVNQMIQDPLFIRARFLDLAAGQFMMTEILRDAGQNNAGVVGYQESPPLFADQDPELVAEGAEIPLVTGSDGLPKAAFTQKYGAGIEITREARDRNRVDMVDLRMKQVRNTFTRLWENKMFSAFDAIVGTAAGATTQNFAVGSTVSGDTAPRVHILGAAQVVREAVYSSTTQQSPSYFGFEPDTIAMSTRTAQALIGNSALTSLYNSSPMVERSPLYTGYLERQLLGLTVLTSRFLPDAVAYVMEKNTVGGYSDERPLQVSPLYADNPREVWRADAVRRTAIFFDQPKAVAKLTWTGL